MKLIPDAVNPLAWAGWLCELWQTPLLQDWDVPIGGAELLAEAEAGEEVWHGYPLAGPPNWVEHPEPPTLAAVPASDWLSTEVRKVLRHHGLDFLEGEKWKATTSVWGFEPIDGWVDRIVEDITKILEQ